MSYGGTSYRRVRNQYFDPLGPTSLGKKGVPHYEVSGAPAMRGAIFNQLNALRPQSQADAAAVSGAARSAASDPGWAAASKMAGDTAAGKYLRGSPEVDAAVDSMRSAAAREAGDAAANIRSSFARNGVGYGTANQQAEQSARALATARANDTEAGIRMQNYLTERQNQMQSPAVLDAANEGPLKYLDAASKASYAPLALEGQLIQGLAGNGQILKPDVIEDKSGAERAMDAFGNI